MNTDVFFSSVWQWCQSLRCTASRWSACSSWGSHGRQWRVSRDYRGLVWNTCIERKGERKRNNVGGREGGERVSGYENEGVRSWSRERESSIHSISSIPQQCCRRPSWSSSRCMPVQCLVQEMVTAPSAQPLPWGVPLHQFPLAHTAENL